MTLINQKASGAYYTPDAVADEKRGQVEFFALKKSTNFSSDDHFEKWSCDLKFSPNLVA